MQGTISSDSTRSKRSEVAMGIANNKGGDETSGLYDLKELASSAKKRRSQRLSSEMDAQQSLLQSSAALDAVALPDPRKSQEIALPVLGLDVPSKVSSKASAERTRTAAAEPMVFTEQAQARTSSKGWLFAFAALLIVGGGAAYFVLAGDSESSSSSAPRAALAAEGSASETATPVLPLPAAIDDEEDVASPDTDLPEVAPLVDVEAPQDDSEEVDSKKNAGSAKQATETKDETKSARVDATDDDKGTKTDNVKVTKPESAASKEKVKEPVKTEDLDSNASVDDILSTVTGGIDKKETAVEDKGPTKKGLERGDIAKAMKKISPAAKACYAVEEFSGMVSVKYSVDPDGKVSGVEATGAHKSSKTGACVANAVKGASFPAFDGPVASFSFPILLSP